MYYVCYFILETTGNFMWISLRVRADPVVLKLSYELYYFAGALVTIILRTGLHVAEAHNQLLWLWISSSPKISVRTENNS